MTTWHITIKGSEDWPDEHLELTSDRANSRWFDGGVVIETHPTGFGDFNVERVVPWSQVVEWSRDARVPR